MKKKLAAVVLSMVLCLGASVTTLAAGSPSANNSSTTTSQTTTAATEVKVEQKAITQDARDLEMLGVENILIRVVYTELMN